MILCLELHDLNLFWIINCNVNKIKIVMLIICMYRLLFAEFYLSEYKAHIEIAIAPACLLGRVKVEGESDGVEHRWYYWLSS